MGIRISSDRHECRVVVDTPEDISALRTEMERLTGTEPCIVMPDEMVKTLSGYEMVFKNRHNVKEYLCFEGFDEHSYRRFLSSVSEIFRIARRNNLSPYSFVFDINCMFTENDLGKISFVYTPGVINKNNNLCSDVLSLVSLYSGYETDSPMEKMMRENMETVRKWEEERESQENAGDTACYDFPLEKMKEPGGNRDKSKGKIICFSGFSPIITVISCSEDGEVIGIGRDREWAKVCVKSIFASRKHATVRYRNGMFYLEDLNSTNGTMLNGKKIAPAREYELSAFNKIETGEGSRFFLVCGL